MPDLRCAGEREANEVKAFVGERVKQQKDMLAVAILSIDKRRAACGA
jgi:hypothetical protein